MKDNYISATIAKVKDQSTSFSPLLSPICLCPFSIDSISAELRWTAEAP